MCIDCGCAPADHHHDHEHGKGKTISIEEDLLSKNNRLAGNNRALFQQKGLLVLNLVSSPGSGKTTILETTLKDLQGELGFAVLEGDQQTSNDADRIAATQVPVVQVNTGKGCHLDSDMVNKALNRLKPDDDSLLMIENVGNLVCPAMFDLGESARVVIMSVTEGDDKPLKYPDMFQAADLMLINKIDLLPHVDFDVERCIAYARRVNADIQVFQVSATRADGLDGWLAWLQRGLNAAVDSKPAAHAGGYRRVPGHTG